MTATRARGSRVLLFVLLVVTGRAYACEPVVPFLQVVAPWLAKARLRVEIDQRLAAIRTQLSRKG